MVFLSCIAWSSPTYFTPKSSSTSVNWTGLQSCVQNLGTNLLCRQPLLLGHFSRSSFANNPACGKPYMPRLAWMWMEPLSSTIFLSWYSSMISSGISLMLMRMYSVRLRGSWGTHLRCPWSWTWRFLWKLHYWRVFLLTTYLPWVVLPRRDSWFGLLQWRNVFCFSRLFIADIADKVTISDILSSGFRNVLSSDKLDCVGGILYATSDRWL